MTVQTDTPEAFREAVAALRSLRPRPELELEELRPPQRLAPWSYAVACDVTGPGEIAAAGRLVVLHDPDCPDSWGGPFRLTIFVRTDLEPALAGDPALPAVGWSYLTDSLDGAGADYAALGGTVTATSSVRFGELDGPAPSDELELRGSWTPLGGGLERHGEGFCALMASMVGLPPVGVALFGERSG